MCDPQSRHETPLDRETHCMPPQIPLLTQLPPLLGGRLPFSCVVLESCEELLASHTSVLCKGAEST